MLLGSGAELEEGEEYDDVDFPVLLRENLNKPVLLLVYNIKAREKRVVELTPSDNWGGAGLLGVTIKLDDYGGADERLVRVLDVDDVENGPARLAGLIPEEDFLLGTTATTLTNTDVLASLLNHHLGQIVELYVYNSQTDLVRVVGLHPTYNWGYGESMLGAAVGTGYLHRLPESCRGTIGKSIERTVSIAPHEDGGEPSEYNESNIVMEGTLEMEVEDDGEVVDGDVGLAARGTHVQPHILGTPHPQSPPKKLDSHDSPECAAIEKVAPPDNSIIDPPPVADSRIEQPEEPVSPKAPPSPSPEENEPTPLPPSAQQDESTAPPPPPPPPENEPAGFPDAAPVPTPPPPPLEPTTQVAPPPPPPPSETLDPDDEEEEYTDDEEGSEYTDASDSEDDEPAQPKRGLFGFMSPPPKMEY